MRKRKTASEGKAFQPCTIPGDVWNMVLQFCDLEEISESFQLTCKTFLGVWLKYTAPSGRVTQFVLNSPAALPVVVEFAKNTDLKLESLDRLPWVEETFGLTLLRRFGPSRVSLTGLVDLRQETNSIRTLFAKWFSSSPDLFDLAEVWVVRNRVVGLHGIKREICPGEPRLRRILLEESCRLPELLILTKQHWSPTQGITCLSPSGFSLGYRGWLHDSQLLTAPAMMPSGVGWSPGAVAKAALLLDLEPLSPLSHAAAKFLKLYKASPRTGKD